MIRIATRCTSVLKRPLETLKDWECVLQEMEKLVYANGHGLLLPQPKNFERENKDMPALDVLRSVKIDERLALNGDPLLKPGKLRGGTLGEDKRIGVTSILNKTMSDDQRKVLRRWRNRMMEEMESSQSDVFGDFCKAKTGEERNAIRLKHFQTNTPFG